MKSKRMDFLKRYEIYKAIRNGWSFKKISNTYKVSTKTIWYIKRNGFYKFDRTLILINTIREKYPYFTLSQIKDYLKKNYNLDISISNIYYKISKTIDKNLYKLIKLLLDDGETEYAVKILRDFLFIQWEYLEVLKLIEDEKLSMSLLADKYYYLLYTGKLTSLHEALLQAENYLKICKDKNLNYSYYKWFNIKIRILQALGKYREVLEIFDYKEIIKLPFSLKSYIFAVVVSCGIKLGDKRAIDILNFYKRRFNSKRNRNNEISKDYKLFLRNQYASLGKFNLAVKYMDEPFLHFWIGNYRRFFKIKEELTIEMKIPVEVSLAICYLFSKNFFGFLKIVDKIQHEVKSFLSYSDEISMVLALKEVFWDNYNNAIEIISKSNSKILRCISSKNYKILSKYRKIELLAKYLLMGNVKRACEIAKKYQMITHLRIYSLLTKKSLKVISRYKDLKTVSYILRNKPRTVKFYFLRKNPIIKLDKKVIISSGRQNDLFALLYYLALEKANLKYASIEELKREGFQNIKHKVYNINRKIGYKILFIHENNVYLNANVWTDIADYLRTKNERFFKSYPFNNLSFRYRWADFYRDIVIAKTL